VWVNFGRHETDPLCSFPRYQREVFSTLHSHVRKDLFLFFCLFHWRDNFSLSVFLRVCKKLIFKRWQLLCIRYRDTINVSVFRLPNGKYFFVLCFILCNAASTGFQDLSQVCQVLNMSLKKYTTVQRALLLYKGGLHGPSLLNENHRTYTWSAHCLVA
jgi:hypothetical protein